MFSIIGNRKSRFPAVRSHRCHCRTVPSPQNRRLALEPLEERHLLSVGDILWMDQWHTLDGRPGNEFAWSVDSGQNVYVAGSTDTLLSDVPTAGGMDAFVRKYDADGTELWTRQFGSSSAVEIYGVSADASGVYVAGYTSGTLPDQNSSGGNDVFVRKYDPDGNELWTRQYGSLFVSTICVYGPGLYVAGRTGYDTFVARLDTAPVVVAVDVGQDLTSLIVHFNDDDLDAELAANPANYRLVAAHGDANGNGDPFDDGDETIVPWAASNPVLYDPVTDRVTLRTADILFEDYYRLDLDGDGADGPDRDLEGNSIATGSPGIANLRGNFIEGGDFAAVLDLTSLGMVDELIAKVDALGLSTGTENSLLGKLEATVRLLGMDTPSEAGVLALLDAFKRGVEHWYSRNEITEEDRNDLLADVDLIILGMILTV